MDGIEGKGGKSDLFNRLISCKFLGFGSNVLCHQLYPLHQICMSQTLEGELTTTLHLGCYGWSVKDYCVVATDVKQKEDCGKSSHWDPESSLLDCLPEGNLLAVALLDTLLDLLQLHLHSWVPAKLAGLEKWMLQKWKP